MHEGEDDDDKVKNNSNTSALYTLLYETIIPTDYEGKEAKHSLYNNDNSNNNGD